MKKIILLLFIAPFILFSCKKGEDEEMPSIQILSPANGLQANVYDTLHVTIHASDNRQLESMHAQLVTTGMAGVLPSVSLAVEGKTADASFNYIIDNHRIETGNYYLAVDAYDGYNLARSYINIHITGIPRVLNGFFAATIPVAGTLNIYKGDTSWNASLFTSYPSDFTDMAVSDYWQQVYTAGVYTGPLKATSIDGMYSGFSQQSISGPSPFWGPLAIKDARLWVAFRTTGYFKSLDYAGNPNFTSAADAGFYPELSLQAGGKLYTEQKDISSAAIRMVVYSTAGGALQENPMSVDAVAMFEKDEDNIYVLGNSSGQGHLLLYDYLTNGFWEPISLPAATITCAAQIDSNEILLGMSNGNVYRFTYNPVGLLTWTTGINPTTLRYDPVNEEIYSAEGTDVKVYSYNSFALLHTIPIPYTVSDLELWFNK